MADKGFFMVLGDPTIVPVLKVAPAAMWIHQACRGGLLEHVLSMCELADVLVQKYSRLNRDLLIAGAVLHEIGKVEELGSSRWKSESGFLKYRWEGYDEALLLYVLGLGSPTHTLPEESYAAWASTYRWEHCYGQEYLYAGPLFTHQLSHVWIDFRGIQDAFMRDKGIDYFENSRRATYVQHNTRSTTHSSSRAMALVAGELPQARAPGLALSK